MSYLFHFSQKSAEITVFLDFFWEKKEISNISINEANMNILTIALDSVGVIYLELI